MPQRRSRSMRAVSKIGLERILMLFPRIFVRGFCFWLRAPNDGAGNMTKRCRLRFCKFPLRGSLLSCTRFHRQVLCRSCCAAQGPSPQPSVQGVHTRFPRKLAARDPKHRVSRLFFFFAHLDLLSFGLLFFDLLVSSVIFSSLLFSSLTSPIFTFHASMLSEVSLLNFLG